MWKNGISLIGRIGAGDAILVPTRLLRLRLYQFMVLREILRGAGSANLPLVEVEVSILIIMAATILSHTCSSD